MDIVNVNGLGVSNLTPHGINLIDERYTHEERSGRRLLRDNVNLENATTIFIERGSMTLSVAEPPIVPSMVGGNLKLFKPICHGYFNQVIPREMLNTADIIVVSQKCVGLLTANMLLVGAGGQSGPLSVIDADKFYIPKDIVYRREKPCGAMGLQKILPHLSMQAYATSLQNGYPVSCASLFGACQEYCCLPIFQRTCETELAVINAHLVSKGWAPYPGLTPVDPIMSYNS